MSESEPPSESQFPTSQKHFFALGSFMQFFINTAFTTWTFSFYFSAVHLNVVYIMWAFIIWSVFIAIDDPLIGFISDHIRTRWGRRKPFIMIATIPIIIIEILLWSPTQLSSTSNQIPDFIYLVVMLLCYDLFYTMISLPYDSLFPELYTSVKERAQVNMLKQVYGIFGLLAAFLLSGTIIGDIYQMGGYFINGIVTSIICGLALILSLKYGVTERTEFKLDHKVDFGFFQGIKYVFKNKGFVLYTIMYFAYEYTLLVLAAMVPQYAVYVLGVSANDNMATSILLGVLFVVGLLTVPVWSKIDLKLGSRKGLFIAVIAYLIASIPLTFVKAYDPALIVVACMGFGYGGMIYFVYLIIADVVDEDELKTKVRREGNFFGITTFFMRLSGVLFLPDNFACVY